MSRADLRSEMSVGAADNGQICMAHIRGVMWPLWVWAAGQVAGPDPEEIFSELVSS
jgi:hypothetical protein